MTFKENLSLLLFIKMLSISSSRRNDVCSVYICGYRKEVPGHFYWIRVILYIFDIADFKQLDLFSVDKMAVQ
jgi:hypothetical protein